MVQIGLARALGPAGERHGDDDDDNTTRWRWDWCISGRVRRIGRAHVISVFVTVAIIAPALSATFDNATTTRSGTSSGAIPAASMVTTDGAPVHRVALH